MALARLTDVSRDRKESKFDAHETLLFSSAGEISLHSFAMKGEVDSIAVISSRKRL